MTATALPSGPLPAPADGAAAEAASAAPPAPRVPGSLLDIACVAYLGAPVLLFAVTWLEPLLSLAAALAIGAGAWPLRRVMRERVSVPGASQLALVALLVAVSWVALSGAGGVVYANGDWDKHHGILGDLVNNPWPVTFPAPSGDEGLFLRYYLAWYLVPAAAAKALGPNAIMLAEAAWTVLGAALVMAQVLRGITSGVRLALAAVAFVAFSGADLLGYLFFDAPAAFAVVPGPLSVTTHMEWWAGAFEYSSLTTLMFWTPQHALAGWMVTAMVLGASWRGGLSRVAVMILAFVGFWSPFAAVGVVPFVGWRVVQSLRARRFRAEWLSVSNLLLAPPLALLLAAYVTAASGDLPKGWIWDAIDVTAPQFAIFLLLEVGLLAGALMLARRDRLPVPGLVALAVLCLLPLVMAGRYNDLAMRASIPAVFVLAWLVVRLVESSERFRLRYVPLLGVLLLGAATPLTEIARALKTDHKPRVPSALAFLTATPVVPSEEPAQLPELASQYYALEEESPFLRAILRDASPAYRALPWQDLTTAPWDPANAPALPTPTKVVRTPSLAATDDFGIIWTTNAVALPHGLYRIEGRATWSIDSGEGRVALENGHRIVTLPMGTGTKVPFSHLFQVDGPSARVVLALGTDGAPATGTARLDDIRVSRQVLGDEDPAIVPG